MIYKKNIIITQQVVNNESSLNDFIKQCVRVFLDTYLEPKSKVRFDSQILTFKPRLGP